MDWQSDWRIDVEEEVAVEFRISHTNHGAYIRELNSIEI